MEKLEKVNEKEQVLRKIENAITEIEKKFGSEPPRLTQEGKKHRDSLLALCNRVNSMKAKVDCNYKLILKLFTHNNIYQITKEVAYCFTSYRYENTIWL